MLNIVLKANADGEIVRLKDVADLHPRSSYKSVYPILEDRPLIVIVVNQVSNSNTSTLMKEVVGKLENLTEYSTRRRLAISVSDELPTACNLPHDQSKSAVRQTY